MKHFYVINGPNLNLTGNRETHIYGTTTLSQLAEQLRQEFTNSAQLEFFQNNHERNLIDYLQSLTQKDGIVINPGALSHTSIALRDALVASQIPAIEVHISNIFKREQFRHHSYISSVCIGSIFGLGINGYKLAVQALLMRG